MFNTLKDSDWNECLMTEFKKPYFINILSFLKKEQSRGKIIFPKDINIFNALRLSSFKHTKVIIIGQDPYHGENQANGLCFSVNKGTKIPPSLNNIYKELKNEFEFDIPDNGDLSSWAQQGVLMLNTYLTVEKGMPTSHQNIGWDIFTNKIINIISHEKKNLVFLLWGKHAQEIEENIQKHKQHLILKSAHPSPFSAHRGFLGNNHFKLCNDYLNLHQQKEINWKIVNTSPTQIQKKLF